LPVNFPATPSNVFDFYKDAVWLKT
jgi:hypothetical protein